ncbi:PIN domain-containing protein [Nesterenkonia alkaliphila]|uniref:PIN domain-containing protein n=1 Tax=Nesterenkonia alkaliphila TaxID=1463631 RepID=A0A7K1UEX2_9MICC|nr:PIN domain-containing protein [Nesterenkonia alkaliphila]MVT24916.1 PIN domain-containing protein [Nesterenkonia alkaliphila]GFZ86695.1 hypothetical protein GCM10011359_14660 [Nesterenkonia alkaliphila]
MSAPVVLLDANVLVPQRLSSLLLTLAERDLFQPRWSDRILDEVERTLVNKLGLGADKVARRLAAMRRAFPRAAVVGLEDFTGDPRCHPKDQHVYAAAQWATADLLVTFNLSDFPAESSQPGDVPVRHPDHFLLRLWAEHQQAVESGIEYEAKRMRRPPMDVRGVLSGIAPITPMTANTLHNHWGQRATTLPAYEAADPMQSPYAGSMGEPDFGKPDHVLYVWWTALADRFTNAAAKEVLHSLTWLPEAFGDYEWVDEMLRGYSLASKVYYAVDAPEEVAYMRFIPEVAQSSRTFAPMAVPSAVFVTLVRTGPKQWMVWGLGDHMPSLRDIRG